MIRTRLYLAACLASLVAAVSIAEFDLCPGKLICNSNRTTGNYVPHHLRELPPDAYALLYHHAISGQYEEAVRIARERLADNGSDGAARMYLAYALRGEGRVSEALGEYSRIVDQYRHTGPEHHWLTIDALTGRAACFTAVAEPSKALADLELAEKLAMEQDSRESGDRSAYQLACVHAQFVGAYKAMGQDWRARTRISEAAEQIKLAQDRGYDDCRHIDFDLDLDPIRDHPEFLALWRCTKTNIID